jgi:hypothetical protein
MPTRRSIRKLDRLVGQTGLNPEKVGLNSRKSWSGSYCWDSLSADPDGLKDRSPVPTDDATRDSYRKALLRAVITAGDKGKKPAHGPVINAAAAGLNISDRQGLTDALDKLLDDGLVADKKNRLSITESGLEADSTLDPDQDKRLVAHLSVTFKEQHPSGLAEVDLEILFVIAVAEHHRQMVGSHTISQVFDESIDQAQQQMDALVEGGYLESIQFDTGADPVTVYGLTKAGKFELRRGPLRADSIRYPESQSDRARELTSLMEEMLGDE